MSLSQVSAAYWRAIIFQVASRRRPLAVNTIALYQHNAVRLSEIIGYIDLADIKNATARTLIDTLLSEHLSAASINSLWQSFIAICDFPTDTEGEKLYPKTFNLDFIGLPTVRQSEQQAPMISTEQVLRVVK